MSKNTLKQMLDMNYKNSKRLEKSYLKIYENMVLYIKTSTVSDWEAEEVLNDILLILLEAQERGESAAAVIGPDYKDFCNQMLEPFENKSSKALIQSKGKLALEIFGCSILMCWIINLLLNGELSLSHLTSFSVTLEYVLMVIINVPLCFFIFKMIRNDAFKKNTFFSTMISGAIVTMVLMAFALMAKNTEHILLFKVHTIWLIVTAVAIVLIAHLLYNNKPTLGKN